MTTTPTNSTTTRPTWHGVTWLVWAVSAAATVQLAPSPVYVALVIAVAAVVVQAHAREGPLTRVFPVLVAVAVFFACLRVVLTVATTHGGTDVLFTTPEFTLPRLLGGFTVGGTVETSVLAISAAEAFAVVGVIAVFAAFNAVVSHHELVQSAPRAFHELGLVVVVALAFVPSTVRAIGAVREADRARTGGRVVRRGRLVRLVVPILESGLERAVSLAESMDARGFARGKASPREQLSAWCGLGALVLLGGGFVALVGEASGIAATLAVAGCGALVLAVVLSSTASSRVRYRRRRLTAPDLVVAGLSVVAPTSLWILSSTGEDSLVWRQTLPLEWPAFHFLPAVAILFLLAPVTIPLFTFWRRTGVSETSVRRQNVEGRVEVPA
jgi:energy-coupling factor transport system permease protein